MSKLSQITEVAANRVDTLLGNIDDKAPAVSIPSAAAIVAVYKQLLKERQEKALTRVIESILAILKRKTERNEPSYVASASLLGSIDSLLNKKRRAMMVKNVSEILLIDLNSKNQSIKTSSNKALQAFFRESSEESKKHLAAQSVDLLTKHLIIQSSTTLQDLDCDLAQTLAVICQGLDSNKRMKIVENVLNKLLAGLNNSSWYERLDAMRTFGAIYQELPQEKPKEIVLNLVRALLKGLQDTDQEMILLASKALGFISSKELPQEMIIHLIDKLLTKVDHNHEELFAASVEAVGMVMHSFASNLTVAKIMNSLLTGLTKGNQTLRLASLKTLRRFFKQLPQQVQIKHTEDIFKALLLGMRDKDTDICFASVRVLSSILKHLSKITDLQEQLPRLKELLKFLPIPKISNEPPNELKNPQNELSSEETSDIDESIEPKIDQEMPSHGYTSSSYSENEVDALLRMQLFADLEDFNNRINLCSRAATLQQFKSQFEYALSVVPSKTPVISIIPLFLNGEKNNFHTSDHWALLMLVKPPIQQNQLRPLVIYQNPLGLKIPDSINQHLQGCEFYDLQIKQQANENDSAPWIVYTACNLVQTFQDLFSTIILLPQKIDLQDCITPVHRHQGSELHQFYQKLLVEKADSALPKLIYQSQNLLTSPANQQYEPVEESPAEELSVSQSYKLSKKTPLPLENMGNSCYINATLQLLFMIPEICGSIKNNQNVPLIQNLFHLLEQKELKKNLKSLREAIFQARGKGELEGDKRAQHDAHELLLLLFNQFEKYQLNSYLFNTCSITKGKDHKNNDFTKVSQEIFENCLTIAYADNMNFQQLLDHHFEWEKGMDEYTLEEEKTSVKKFAISYQKKICINSAPDYIFVQLKRFDHQRNKLLFTIELPEDDLISLVVNDKEKVSYRIVGYVNHHGMALREGHYTADVKRSFDPQEEARWFHCNDDKITQQSPKNPGKQAYIILLKRIT